MKIKTENHEPIRCPKCGSDDFKPLGGGKFACLTCETPTTTNNIEKETE